ncbi:MAG: hypothetical protein Q4C50_04975 [Eubacteriales bacterium]|nr:hypothetical protein [Eubacteriales bacterium]
MEESSKTPLTAVDRIADGNGLQMMKAAIPYLPLAMQKSFSVYVKIMEVSNVLSYYNQPVRACSAPSEETNAEDILNDIRSYCNDTQRQSLDQALHLINTLKMYQEIQKNC